MQLIDEFKPITETTYLLVDAWYISEKRMIHALEKGYHTIGKVMSIKSMTLKMLLSCFAGANPVYLINQHLY